MLSVRNLCVSSEGKEIIRDFSCTIDAGEIVALIGPNGSGKSTLANTLMGHPRYDVTGGTAEFMGESILSLAPEDRAKRGIFLSFQYPQEIAGISLARFLRRAHTQITNGTMTVLEFSQHLNSMCDLLGIDRSFIDRSINEGFSGGEKKRAEILQLAVLRPKLAILDETDSGLDADALRVVAKGLEAIRKEQPDMAILLITHYERFLEFLSPSRVLVMKNGTVAAEGGKELVDRVQEEGYEKV